jgi:hypothetical protein
MKRVFIFSICCLCVLAGVAQSKKLDEWKQKALAKKISWQNFTREATAAHNRIYYSLYVDGQFVASFKNAGSCNAKKQELHSLAKQIFNSNTARKTNSSRSNEKLQQAIRELGGTPSGLKGQLEAARDKEYAKSQDEEKKKMLSDVDRLCECSRPETNPNYNSDVKPYDFGNTGLTPDKNTPDNTNVLSGGTQTQYDNPFDAIAATQTQPPAATNTQPSVNFDFSDMDKYVSNGSNGIYVGDVNKYKGIIPQPPIYLGDPNNANSRTVNMPEKQDPNRTYNFLPKDKEQGIQFAQDLLPKAENLLAKFDENMVNIEENIALREKQLFDIEKEKILIDYESTIVMNDGIHLPYTMEQYEPILKEKFNMTDEELKNFRNKVYTKLSPDAIINENINLSSHTKKALEGDGESGEGADVVGGLTSIFNSEKLEAYGKQKKSLEENISVLNEQLNGYYTNKERLITDKEDVQKTISYYSNVIQNGKVTVNSKNDIDAMNLGFMLNNILNK